MASVPVVDTMCAMADTAFSGAANADLDIAVVLPATVRESVEKLIGKPVAWVRRCPAGRPNPVPAIIGFSGTSSTIFAKWSTSDDPSSAVARSLAVEADALSRVVNIVPTARLLGFDATIPVLVCEALDGSEPNWQDLDALAGAGVVLDALAAANPALGRGAPLKPWHTFHRKRNPSDACILGTAVASTLWECYSQAKDLPTERLAHADAWPGNWVTHQSQIRLVDFENLTVAPVGLDDAYFATYLNLPAQQRAAWLLDRGGNAETTIMVGATAFRLACHASRPDVGSRYLRRCAAVLPRAIELYYELDNS